MSNLRPNVSASTASTYAVQDRLRPFERHSGRCLHFPTCNRCSVASPLAPTPPMTPSNNKHPVRCQKLLRICPACGTPLCSRSDDHRTIVFPGQALQFVIPVARCQQSGCPLYCVSYRSEGAGRCAPRYSRYSFQVICTAGNLNRVARTRPALQKLLAEHDINVSLRTIPSLLDRFDALLSGQNLTDPKLLNTLEAQGCVVLDVFWVRGAGNNGFWMANELLSSSPLKIVPYETSGPANIQRHLAAVARKIPVPVVGFTSDDDWFTKAAIWHLLKYSGKGPSRYCQLSDLAGRFSLFEISSSLARMVQQYHEYRKKNPDSPGYALPAKRSRTLNTPPLDSGENGKVWGILQDWHASGDATPEQYCDYRYAWNLWKDSYRQ